jgi:hypothetical protein
MWRDVLVIGSHQDLIHVGTQHCYLGCGQVEHVTNRNANFANRKMTVGGFDMYYVYIHTEREKICYVYMLYAICGSLIIYTQHEKNVLFSLSCLLTLGYSRSGPFPSRQGSCSAGQPVWARRLCARRSRRPSLELRTADGNGTFFKQNYGKPQNMIPKSSGTSNGGCAPATMVTHFLGGQYLWDHVHD